MPAQFLVRNRGLFLSRTGPSLGVLVFLLGAACLVAALVGPERLFALPGGAGVLVVASWYAIRLRNYGSGSLRDLLGRRHRGGADRWCDRDRRGILSLSRR